MVVWTTIPNAIMCRNRVAGASTQQTADHQRVIIYPNDNNHENEPSPHRSFDMYAWTN